MSAAAAAGRQRLAALFIAIAFFSTIMKPNAYKRMCFTQYDDYDYDYDFISPHHRIVSHRIAALTYFINILFDYHLQKTAECFVLNSGICIWMDFVIPSHKNKDHRGLWLSIRRHYTGPGTGFSGIQQLIECNFWLEKKEDASKARQASARIYTSFEVAGLSRPTKQATMPELRWWKELKGELRAQRERKTDRLN